MNALRTDAALQHRIAELLERQPLLTSRKIAEQLDAPMRDVTWEIVVMVHRRRLVFDGERPARYRLSEPEVQS